MIFACFCVWSAEPGCEVKILELQKWWVHGEGRPSFELPTAVKEHDLVARPASNLEVGTLFWALKHYRTNRTVRPRHRNPSVGNVRVARSLPLLEIAAEFGFEHQSVKAYL